MKLYISTDLNVNSSGGIVAKKELEAMKELDKDVIELGFQDIHPLTYGLPDQPFLIDFLTLEKLSKLDLSNVDIAQMYGGCYPNTIRFLKSRGVKTTYSCMMHERKVSIEEHEKYYGAYPFPHVKDDRLWPMYIGGIKEADIVITPGSAPKKSLLKEGARKVEIIPHGCDIPDENNIKPFPNEFRMGYLGACGPDKGLIYLIEGWSTLNYQDNSTLLFAGNQSQYLRPFIQKYAAGGNYHLSGYINYIKDFYNNVSVYIQPSSTEGFGLETLEAMSYGRPVIVSNGAGSADCVTDSVDGFVVPKMNSRAIAEKIDFFKKNPDKIIEFGNKAREKSFQYSWDKVKLRYIDIWKNLLRE